MPEATRIKNLPASEKPRERLFAKGANALRDRHPNGFRILPNRD